MDDLFTEKPIQVPVDKQMDLIAMVEQLEQKRLVLPPFQRDFCWQADKVKGWAESIIKQNAIGVIVTYQLQDGGTRFLADGLQRLTATSRFMKNPEKYGFTFGESQAKEYVEAFSISVQHRVYRDHRTAWRAFQNLNKGTALTPKEFYKGELCGSAEGELIYIRVPEIVNGWQKQFVNRGIIGRNPDSRLHRDSLGLFLQYISDYQYMTFWDVASSVITERTPVEEALNDFILTTKPAVEDVKKFMVDFDNFIAEQLSEIRTVIDDSGQRGKGMSPTVFRWLLHLSIWRRNTKRPFVPYQDFLKKFILVFTELPRFTSRFSIRTSNPVATVVSLSIGDLKLAGLNDALDCQLYSARPRRRAKSTAANGYNVSHINPFSINGDGPTIFEPAPRNKSRGAAPIASGD